MLSGLVWYRICAVYVCRWVPSDENHAEASRMFYIKIGGGSSFACILSWFYDGQVKAHDVVILELLCDF